MSRPEHALQAACISWFRYQYPKQAPLLFSVCNSAFMKPAAINFFKAEGMTSGVSDLIYLSPNGPLLIEMKTKTGRQSDSQKKWQQAAEAAGYKYVICRSLDDFQANITKLCS